MGGAPGPMSHPCSMYIDHGRGHRHPRQPVLGSGAKGRAPSGVRHQVTVDGVVGVLVCRGGRWMLGNDPEVQMLEALCGPVGARDRLLALVAALDADAVTEPRSAAVEQAVGPDRTRGGVSGAGAGGTLMGAVAYACAFWRQRPRELVAGVGAVGAAGSGPGSGVAAGSGAGVDQMAQTPATERVRA